MNNRRRYYREGVVLKLSNGSGVNFQCGQMGEDQIGIGESEVGKIEGDKTETPPNFD